MSRFDGLLSFGEAAEIWGLENSTLRKAVSYGKLQEGKDCKKYGKQWVVLVDAMQREYGLKNKNGEEIIMSEKCIRGNATSSSRSITDTITAER